jgi:hypothetical protein
MKKNSLIESVNTSKLFLGIMLILLNLGSKYLVDEFSTTEEDHSRNIILRRIAVFAVCFVGTRDIVTSLILTSGFVILASGVERRPTPKPDTKKLASPYAPDAPLFKA